MNLVTTKKYAEKLGLKKAKEHITSNNLNKPKIVEGYGCGWDLKFKDNSGKIHYIEVKCYKDQYWFYFENEAKEKFDKLMEEENSICDVYFFVHKELKIVDFYIIPYKKIEGNSDGRCVKFGGKKGLKDYTID